MAANERRLLLAGAFSVCSTVNSGRDDCGSGGDAGANWPARWWLCFGWHYNGAGTPGRKGVILSVSPALRRFRLFTTTVITKATQHHSDCPFCRCDPRTGESDHWNGKSVKLPPLKMCIFAGTTHSIAISRSTALLKAGASWNGYRHR